MTIPGPPSNGRLQQYVSHISASTSVALSLVFIVLVALVDHLTGPLLAFSVFYLLPVSLTAWKVGRAAGLAMSGVAALTWGILDWTGGHRFEMPLLYVWNPLVRLAFFVVVTLLLARLREMYELQVGLARTDALTGAANRRTLLDALGLEIARSSRTGRPFTVAYADLDGFKGVNDSLGHRVGDEVLCALVGTFSAGLRPTDLLARIGGDEFVLLLPETSLDEAARLLGELKDAFRDRARAAQWPVDVTLGAVAFASVPRSPEEAIQLADDLLIDCKRDRRGSLGLAVASAPRLRVSRVAGEGPSAVPDGR